MEQVSKSNERNLPKLKKVLKLQFDKNNFSVVPKI